MILTNEQVAKSLQNLKGANESWILAWGKEVGLALKSAKADEELEAVSELYQAAKCEEIRAPYEDITRLRKLGRVYNKLGITELKKKLDQGVSFAVLLEGYTLGKAELIREAQPGMTKEEMRIYIQGENARTGGRGGRQRLHPDTKLINELERIVARLTDDPPAEEASRLSDLAKALRTLGAIAKAKAKDNLKVAA